MYIVDLVISPLRNSNLPTLPPLFLVETLKQVKVVKNGKTYPMKGTCKAIWDMCEKLYKESGEAPTPAKMQEVGIENKWHKVTVYRQFNDWKKFKGL